MYGITALAQLAAVALLGEVVAALQQPCVDLWMRAPVDGQQRLENGPYGRLTGRGDQSAGEAIANPATMLLALLGDCFGSFGRRSGGEDRGGGGGLIAVFGGRCHG